MTTTVNTTIPKGQMLDRIFKHMDSLELSNKMVTLFLKNGMDKMNLTELRDRSEKDYLQWRKWYNRNNRLMSFTTYTVLEH